jgi:phage tail sheath protein FI
VRDFFLNGGAQAVIVRLYKPQASGASAAQLVLPGAGQVPPLFFSAATLGVPNPGVWGNQITLVADANPPSLLPADVLALYGPNLVPGDFFNLTVSYNGVVVERFTNLTIRDPSPRRIDRVLAQQSRYLTLSGSSSSGGSSSSSSSGGTAVTPVLFPSVSASGLGMQAANAINATPTGGTAGTLASGQDSQPLDDNAYLSTGVTSKLGIYALENTDLFNLLVIPPDVRGSDAQPSIASASSVLPNALAYAVNRRAILIVDPPFAWETGFAAVTSAAASGSLQGLSGPNTRNAAIYYPHLVEADPLRQGQTDVFPPSGAVAGIIAATDVSRGVWKAPAGVDAAIQGIQNLSLKLTNNDNGQLNPLGVNVLRTFPVSGSVVWGARTMRGADSLGDDYKYLPVRRLALYIEESLYRGTQWVVFEPNDTPLWAQIRANVSAFMNGLFRKGAFQGSSPQTAYFVKCDSETTTQTDINNGIVNIIVGFAPLKPAEFVVISIQQMTGQNAS